METIHVMTGIVRKVTAKLSPPLSSYCGSNKQLHIQKVFIEIIILIKHSYKKRFLSEKVTL